MNHGIAKAAPVIRWQVACAECGPGVTLDTREQADVAAAQHNNIVHHNRTKEESTH